MFKRLILLVVLISVSASFKHELSEEDKKIRDDCVAELGYELPARKRGERPSAEDREKFHCIMKCTGVKKGLVSEDGELNAEKIQETLGVDADKANEIVEACKDRTADDECGKVAHKVKCVFHQGNPRKGRRHHN